MIGYCHLCGREDRELQLIEMTYEVNEQQREDIRRIAGKPPGHKIEEVANDTVTVCREQCAQDWRDDFAENHVSVILRDEPWEGQD